MSFTYGPRYDHGCMAILKDDEKYILTVGGWNNSAMAVSELYSVKDERWSVELISSKKFSELITIDFTKKFTSLLQVSH